jgi:hypothetical protein
MTPRDAWLIVTGFVLLLGLLTVVFEQTETGRRFTQRAIDWILR